jgi:nucleoid DNA-binding protein
MTKSELTIRLYDTNIILNATHNAFGHGDKVQVFGFGSFNFIKRSAQLGRNAKSGYLCA